jgi:hypothetical protein
VSVVGRRFGIGEGKFRDIMRGRWLLPTSEKE